MRISEQTIHRIKEAAQIEEVIGEFVTLKRRGANFWACCPFHQEKTPSFSVSPSKGIYKCFGCGAAGDAVKFLMELEGMSYSEALLYLAKKYHIQVEEEKFDKEHYRESNTQRESLLIVLNFAKNFFVKQLNQSPEGQSVGWNYLKERGVGIQAAQTFELGYSPANWQALQQAAIKQQFSLELLEKSGLVVAKEQEEKKQFYDRFRGRIIFPIHDLVGRVIAFGARALKAEEKPKYLNSPEIEGIYHKSDSLYGIFQAKQAIRQADNCYLTEGYLDVIAMHQAGIPNVVASSGTSLTEGQIKLIKRFTENVTVIYDGDAAGIKASLRGIDMLLEEGLNVRAILMPSGEDPDSFIRKQGSQAFKDFLQQHTKDFITFKAQILLSEAGNDPIKKASATGEIALSIAKIPNAIKREIFARQCAAVLQISEPTIFAEVNRWLWELSQQKKHQSVASDRSSISGGMPPLQQQESTSEESEIFQQHISAIVNCHEAECLRLLLKYGGHLLTEGIPLWQYLLQEIEDIEFHTPVYRQILEMYKQAAMQGTLPDERYFVDNGSPEIATVVGQLTQERYEASPNWQCMHEIYIPRETDKLPTAVYETVLRLKKGFIEQLEAEVFAELRRAEKAGDEKSILQQLKVYHHLAQQRMAIAKELGNVISPRKKETV